MKRKAIMLSVAMAVLLAMPTMMSAQIDKEGSFFGSKTSENSGGLMNQRGSGGFIVSTQEFGSGLTGGFEVSTQQFGQDSAPVGSGLLVLLAAGAGYALVRRKQSK